MGNEICSTKGRVLPRGVFDARACKWGIAQPAPRGIHILDKPDRPELIALNISTTPTTQSPGCKDTTPGMTFATEVLKDFTDNDHLRDVKEDLNL